ncbi:MAG: hypothetical protein QM817_34610 [Archangium sp.]
MAAKKKTTAKVEAPAVVNRAYENGERAFGAKYVKKGFALTPQLDLQFALGHRSAMAPAELTADIAPGKKINWSHSSVARNVALAELRKSPNAPVGELTLEENPAPLDVEEAQKLLRDRMPKLVYRPITLRAIEAMVGPSAIVSAYVDGIENMKKQAWDNGGVGALFYPLYGLLLRALPEESAAARKRLLAVLEAKKGEYRAGQLKIMLHGRAGIATDGYKYSTKFKSYQRSDGDDPSNVNDLCFCADDDSAWVASQFAALWEAFKFKVQNMMNGPSPARLFFLGGDATLETELKVVSQYPGTRQADAFASYADLASPRAVELIKHLAKPTSKVKKLADAWLEQHG